MTTYSRASSCFAITFNHVEWTKDCFAEFILATDDVQRLAIAQEEHHPPLDCITGEAPEPNGYHHHVFIEFITPKYLEQVRQYCAEFLGDEPRSVNVQCCKSPKSWLLYITKEDDRPYLFGVRISECSLYARCWHHAKSNYRVVKPIDRNHPFIISLGQYQRFGLGIIEQHLTSLRLDLANRRSVFEPNRNCSITREILSSLSSSASHLYITGAPGLGKTEVIDWFMKGRVYWKAGDPSGFLFGTLNDTVEFIWFEDFDMFKYQGNLNTMLSLMDHKETTISKKCCDDRTITCPARHVYISNFHIPADFPMFRRRVKVIDVSHSLYLCSGCLIYDNGDANDILSTL